MIYKIINRVTTEVVDIFSRKNTIKNTFNKIKKGDLSLETIVIFILSVVVLAVVAYYFVTKYHAGSHNILNPGQKIVSGNFSTNFSN